jgi:hypothetical protein
VAALGATPWRGHPLDFAVFEVDNPYMAPRKTYTISDGKLVLTLTEAEEGGYVVTSPMDPD